MKKLEGKWGETYRRWGEKKCRTTPCTQNIEKMLIKENEKEKRMWVENQDNTLTIKIKEGDEDLKSKQCKIYQW